MHQFKRFLIAVGCFLSLSSVQANITLQEMSGRQIPFSSLAGKWVFINYWAKWCNSCIEEIPVLNHFYQANKANNVVVFAVNYDGLPLEVQQKLIRQMGIHYPSLSRDPALDLGLEDISGIPVTFVFNPRGELSNTLYGRQTGSSLRAACARHPETQ